ncbi:hypothetical protein N9N67_12265, partial [Bacteriovoracaceae bacterium]|nr:hypothetical protein [Bacteriovoracaceae bacterium]
MKNKKLMFALMVFSSFTYAQVEDGIEIYTGGSAVRTNVSGADASIGNQLPNSNSFGTPNNAGDKIVGSSNGSGYGHTLG